MNIMSLKLTLTNTHHGTRHQGSLTHINQRISVLHMSAMKIIELTQVESSETVQTSFKYLSRCSAGDKKTI